MPSKYRRARLDAADPRINIRNRYMEAIRAAASIADATEYANADPVTRPVYIVVPADAPMVQAADPVKHRLLPTPGERELLLPRRVAEGDTPPALPAVDESAESVKRPLAAPAAALPLKAAVSAPVETKAGPETPQITRMKPPLPADWDTKDFEWPKLRGLCMAMGLPTPNSRGDAVRAIKAHLEPSAPAEHVAA